MPSIYLIAIEIGWSKQSAMNADTEFMEDDYIISLTDQM